MLSIGSLYGHGFDRGQLERLEGLGFSLRPQTSVYAGSQLCTFVDFPSGPALELIEVTDPADYDSFVPAGMAPYSPGISLLVAEGAPAALAAYERAFADHDPYRLRMPYQEGSDPGAPGWHYLNFGRPLVTGTFIWLTAFDQPKPAPARRIQHANGALGVVDLLFDLPPEGLDDLARLAGQPSAQGGVHFGGVAVDATGGGDPPRRFPLRAVVLRGDDLDRFRAHAPTAEETRFRGRRALLIETNPLAWDLLITS